MITAMYYRVCMAPDSDRTEKSMDFVPARLLQISPVHCKTNEHRNVILSRSQNFDQAGHSVDSIYTKLSVGRRWSRGCQIYVQICCGSTGENSVLQVEELACHIGALGSVNCCLFEVVRGSNGTGFLQFSYQMIVTILVFLVIHLQPWTERTLSHSPC